MREGRKVTRCAQSVYVFFPPMLHAARLVANSKLTSFFFHARLQDINKHCLDEFRKHWQCLDNRNHHLWDCRNQEWSLNKCVYENLVGFFYGRTLSPSLKSPLANTLMQKLVKIIPGAPTDEVPVHLRPKQVFAVVPFSQGTPWVPPPEATNSRAS
jgi:NADH dehydrogenase (ubiquinone) 1 alpha subcomplex subunit 8